MSITLPVFTVARHERDRDRLAVVAEWFGLQDRLAQPDERDGRVAVSDDTHTVEVYSVSGEVFAADHSQLHNPALRPTLPDADRAYRLANRYLERGGFVPALPDGVMLTPLTPGGTYVAGRPRRGKGPKRDERQLDVQARFALTVRNPGVDGEADDLPVVGGGGKLSFSFGDGARLIAVHGGIRELRGSSSVEALDKAEVIQQLDSGLDTAIDPADVSLAYYLATGDVEQELMVPVWLVRSRFDVDHSDSQERSTVTSRHLVVAATAHGPTFPQVPPQPEREQGDPAMGRQHRAALGAPRPAAVGNPNEVGTSWVRQIDQKQPLTGSPSNAQGFVDGMSAGGWQVNFNWGDTNAFESDWDANDDTWVDAADFVFYTGHANQNGWVLCVPGKTQSVLLTPSVVGAAPQTPGDRYGQNDLEWVAIAACGPLQDGLLAQGGGDVLTRWDGAFDGLHTLLGYGAVTYDNTDEGRKLARYTRDGMTVIDAWFRTAKEVQPATNTVGAPDGPTIWVGAMWVTKPGVDPSKDHIWGHGQVSADPTSPTWLTCLWTTC